MKNLMKQLNQFYIPPMTKLYFDRMALEKIVFKAPLFVRISDPDSWLMQEAYQNFKSFNDQAITNLLRHMIAYLSVSMGHTIFEGNRVMSLNEAIPYIEWKDGDMFYASSDLLGQYALFIELSDFEEDLDSLGKIINKIQSFYDHNLRIVVMGKLPEIPIFQQYKNLIWIDPDKTAHISLIDCFKRKSRSGLTLLGASNKPYFLVNPEGRVVTFLSKQDQSSLIEELQKHIVREEKD